MTPRIAFHSSTTARNQSRWPSTASSGTAPRPRGRGFSLAAAAAAGAALAAPACSSLAWAAPSRSQPDAERAGSPTTATSPSDACRTVAWARVDFGSPAPEAGLLSSGLTSVARSYRRVSGPDRPQGSRHARIRPRARPPRCGRTPCRRCRPVPTRCWQSLPRSSSASARPALSVPAVGRHPLCDKPVVLLPGWSPPSPSARLRRCSCRNWPPERQVSSTRCGPPAGSGAPAARRPPRRVVVIGTGSGGGGSRPARPERWPATACR